MFFQRYRISLAALSAAMLATAFGARADSNDDAAARNALRGFDHIVVIYQENHSFDNLYGLWGDVEGRPVEGLPAARDDGRRAPPWRQIRSDADGAKPYLCLPQVDVNLTSPPLQPNCTDSSMPSGLTSSAFYNEPFKIDKIIPADAKTCAAPGVSAPNGVVRDSSGALPGGCTRDLMHRYYSEQYQINGGRMNRYVTGSDAAGLAMGYYDTTKLPIYRYLHQRGAPNYVIADNFFQAAFGGSFLNHQWLIAAKTPVFVNPVTDGGADDLHSVVDANGMPTQTPLYASPDAAKLRDKSLTAYCAGDARNTKFPAAPANVVCGDFVVNTTQPSALPFQPGTSTARLLPPLTHATIGDRLNDAKIDWAWYSGGWSNADGRVSDPGWSLDHDTVKKVCNANTFPGSVYPNCPDKLFQFHHQAFNYYEKYAPGAEARKKHLLDEEEFFAAAKNGLKPVSFVKPLGEENEHPGYASEPEGSTHLIKLINAILDGPNAKSTLIIITYDEFGGSWDHVPPPPNNRDRTAPSDQWGPGTRIPALLISAAFRHSSVDSHAYDTTSVLKLIEERFGLPPLGERDAKVRSLSTAINAVMH